jgi:small subunit ribosomal protein S17
MTNNRRRMTGQVVSNKMDKTVVVRVQRAFRHPLYGKIYGKTVYRSQKFMAHDGENACEIGDEVVMVESRPLSKNKRWVVEKILREDASARTTLVDAVAAVPEAIAETVKSAAKTVAKAAKDVVEAVEDVVEDVFEGDEDDDDEEEDETDE